MTLILDEPLLKELRSELRGPAIGPADPDYETARKVHKRDGRQEAGGDLRTRWSMKVQLPGCVSLWRVSSIRLTPFSAVENKFYARGVAVVLERLVRGGREVLRLIEFKQEAPAA
jgi:hypothetical protein